MARNFPNFLGLVELLTFLVFDFLYARALSAHNALHPELEECAPAGSPDLDPVRVFDGLAAAAAEAVEHPPPTASAFLFFSSPKDREGSGGDGSDGRPTVPSPDANPAPSWSALHATVVLCGIAAPVLTLLALLFPSAFSWTLLSIPGWFAYLVVAPGLAAAVLYAARVITLLELVEVSKTRWISMMWFRLDFLFIMSGVALFGAGAWLVALCLCSVAVYSVYRLIKMEKHLNKVQRDTQLVRDELDVSRVLKPGTAESKCATDIHEGYSAVRA
ncbi:unnamed protein product [Phytomonas sp. EM1]|nr:unnamed protein product [Phytomonas sp. EM1]|eukprot:CCW65538.1 unnamed protein product [Phytomonas sp. isolate EM1]